MNSQLSPSEVLETAYRRAELNLEHSLIKDAEVAQSVRYICHYLNNRAPIRFLMACCLAKIDNPAIDIRAPYTEITDEAYSKKKYSGRTYDEGPVKRFVLDYKLPVRDTTAFLTPAFRTKNIPLLPGINLGGHPYEKSLYDTTLQLLDEVEQGKLSAEEVLVELIRNLLVFKQEGAERMLSLLEELHKPTLKALSSEDIVTLIAQHLSSPRSARLPVLMIAAAYQAASERLGERVIKLESHNAADSQTGTLGDVEITLIDDNRIVTSYEMKMKRVSLEDIERAISKVGTAAQPVDNYIFITTDVIDREVADYVKNLYREIGTEFVILDCLAFLRHFLHLFHRLRLDFLNAYQELVLAEPDSAVRPPLKEALLSLRRAAESSYEDQA